MKITELFASAGLKLPGIPDVEISEIIFDSRKAGVGKLFVALRGDRTDGHKYIDKALEDGCPAVVSEEQNDNKKVVVVPDTKIALANLSHAFYEYPSKNLKMCGVTGTNGKTTITHLLAHMLKSIDSKLGLIGTAGHFLPSGNILSDKSNPTTTPPVTTLDNYFKIMKKNGSQYAVLELSNFGLDRGRLIGFEFDVVAISNITYNHHVKLAGSYEKYIDSKMMAIDLVKKNGTVILNIDDEFYEKARLHAGNRKIITFGNNSGDFFIKSFKPGLMNSTAIISAFGKEYEVFVPIAGRINAINILTALATITGLGLNIEDFIDTLRDFQPISGRWNWIDEGQPFPIVVDKANTESSVQFVLSHLKDFCKGKLTVIIYIVGDGDIQARKNIARVVSEFADLTITTYGFPQGEDIDFTVDQFAGFLEELGANHLEIRDRGEAIEYAISNAGDNNCIAILARGDQERMIVKGKSIRDDRIVAREVLKKRGY